MKKVLAIILSLVMIVSLAGCSLFTSGGEDKGPSKKAVDVKISDTVTHEVPTDLEFETQYALYSGETCALADMFQEQHEVTLNAEYLILYASADDVALLQYTYFVFASEEDAAKYAERAVEFGVTAEVTENVTCEVLDQEEMTNSIDSFIA